MAFNHGVAPIASSMVEPTRFGVVLLGLLGRDNAAVKKIRL